MADASKEPMLRAEIDRLRVAFARLAAKSSQQQAEIKRLTRPMTLERAIAVLGENEHGDGYCEVRDGRVVFTYEDEPRYYYDSLSIEQAVAYAEKIEREKGTTNG